MGQRTIMESFNLDNSYRQKLRFLEQKYSTLLAWRTDKWKENLLKRINDALDDADKIEESDKTYELKKGDGAVDNITTDILYNLRKEWLLCVLSKIKDTDKLKNILAMFAKNGKDISDKESLGEFNDILVNSLWEDINEYKKTMWNIKDIESETTDGHKNEMLFKIISRGIGESLEDVLRKWRGFLDEEKVDVEIDLPKVKQEYDEDGNLVQEDISAENDKLDKSLMDAIRKNFVNPIVFFHTVQRIYQRYNYVITAEEIWKLKKIFSDIKNQKMIFLTWDTWSGKTELCLLISNLYLDEIYGESTEREKKLPILVTWNSETDFSDFTMEKIVTSENYLSSSDDALNREETPDIKQKEFVDKLNKEKEFKEEVKWIINSDPDKDDNEKKQMCEHVDKEDLLEYNIFTKYHLQWMIKAMKEWVPLIIDEMNGIRPEVLLWLNHYFTRKVWQEVSLWNGFTPITIKEWFCIMCTWNDKDENSNAKRYRWRYTIDESLMNRMHRICKWYHRQEIKKFTNENSWDLKENTDMLDYMTKNELYGVILMLLFSKKENKSVDKLWNNEFNKENATKLLTHTEVTAFDLIKEEFVWQESNAEKKKLFFDGLMKLAAFVTMLQDAFQWKPTMCGGIDVTNMMENSQGFSMRDLLTVINSYKNDTKSLWYHLYNDYIKQIPENNQAREWAYLIAKEVWFLDNDLSIDKWSISEITEWIERNLQRERQTSGKSNDFELMDVHNKKLEINESLLADWRLIITKQDMYREYFGDKFSDNIEINDDKIQEYEQELQNGKDSDISENIENNDYTVEGVASICETILLQQENEQYNKFFNKLWFTEAFILNGFCVEHKNEEKVSTYDQKTINEIGRILTMIQNFITEAAENEDFDFGQVNKTILSLSNIQW